MANGFLDDIPEIWPGGTKRHRKKAAAPPPPDPDDECQPPVIYAVVKCPWCDSEETKVYATKKPAHGRRIRHHLCLNGKCKRTFMSVQYCSN